MRFVRRPECPRMLGYFAVALSPSTGSGRTSGRLRGIGCRVAFFPSRHLPSPSFKEDYQAVVPWEEGFGSEVISDVVLAKNSDGAVLLRELVAFPSCITLKLVAQLRRPLVDGPGTRGNNSPRMSTSSGSDSFGTGLVLFGVRFSDGRCFRNTSRRGNEDHLLGIRGGGSSYRGEHEFTIAVPPEGDLELWVAWPAVGLTETRTTLDAGPIRTVVADQEPLWRKHPDPAS
jgi:hypothetical protein